MAANSYTLRKSLRKIADYIESDTGCDISPDVEKQILEELRALWMRAEATGKQASRNSSWDVPPRRTPINDHGDWGHVPTIGELEGW